MSKNNLIITLICIYLYIHFSKADLAIDNCKRELNEFGFKDYGSENIRDHIGSITFALKILTNTILGRITDFQMGYFQYLRRESERGGLLLDYGTLQGPGKYCCMTIVLKILFNVGFTYAENHNNYRMLHSILTFQLRSDLNNQIVINGNSDNQNIERINLVNQYGEDVLNKMITLNKKLYTQMNNRTAIDERDRQFLINTQSHAYKYWSYLVEENTDMPTESSSNTNGFDPYLMEDWIQSRICDGYM